MPIKNPQRRREAGRLAQARYRRRHSLTEEQREKNRLSSKSWRDRNRERHRRYTRQYELAHKTPCPQCGALKKRGAKLCCRCALALRGEQSRSWRGGVVMNHGYRMVYTPDHPARTKAGYVAEHRLVMEKVLGRYLFPDETVHHRNGCKTENQPSNLELWSSKHPSGQRVADLLAWAQEIVARYG